MNHTQAGTSTCIPLMLIFKIIKTLPNIETVTIPEIHKYTITYTIHEYVLINVYMYM